MLDVTVVSRICLCGQRDTKQNNRQLQAIRNKTGLRCVDQAHMCLHKSGTFRTSQCRSVLTGTPKNIASPQHLLARVRSLEQSGTEGRLN
jgi:hypothetical protein